MAQQTHHNTRVVAERDDSARDEDKFVIKTYGSTKSLVPLVTQKLSRGEAFDLMTQLVTLLAEQPRVEPKTKGPYLKDPSKWVHFGAIMDVRALCGNRGGLWHTDFTQITCPACLEDLTRRGNYTGV